jgi:hypothetical protein
MIAQRLPTEIRGDGAIENTLHGNLGIIRGEDASRPRG